MLTRCFVTVWHGVNCFLFSCASRTAAKYHKCGYAHDVFTYILDRLWFLQYLHSKWTGMSLCLENVKQWVLLSGNDAVKNVFFRAALMLYRLWVSPLCSCCLSFSLSLPSPPPLSLSHTHTHCLSLPLPPSLPPSLPSSLPSLPRLSLSLLHLSSTHFLSLCLIYHWSVFVYMCNTGSIRLPKPRTNLLKSSPLYIVASTFNHSILTNTDLPAFHARLPAQLHMLLDAGERNNKYSSKGFRTTVIPKENFSKIINLVNLRCWHFKSY